MRSDQVQRVLRAALVGAVSLAMVVTAWAGPSSAAGRATPRQVSTRSQRSTPEDFAGTQDLAVSGYGDADGYHVQVARESAGFAWQDVAVLRPARLDESRWYGYQCLTGDGTHVAVSVLPGGLINLPGARLRGAY